MSKRVDQALVPMRDFIIGSPGLQTRRFSLHNPSDPWRDVLTVRSSPPTKAADLSVPLDAPKLSRRVSPLSSPTDDSRFEDSPDARRPARTNMPLSVGLAKRSTLVDSVTPHDSSEQQRQDRTSVSFLPLPFSPPAATTIPHCQDYPRIDLVALVREKQKAKKPRKKKLSAVLLQKEQNRLVIPEDLSSEKSR